MLKLSISPASLHFGHGTRGTVPGGPFPRCTALALVLAPTLVLALGRGAGLGDTRLGHAQLQRQVLSELKGGSNGGFERS
jgi:hypothetical protein